MKLPGLSSVILCVLLAGCERLALASPSEQSFPQPQWYQLQNGILQGISADFLTAEMQPWTVQERPAGFVSLAGRLYLAINGRGVVEVRPVETRVFNYHYERDLFNRRTFGGLVAHTDHLICHFYLNTFLGASQDGGSGAAVNLVKLYPTDTGHRIDYVSPPTQQKDPDWEMVGFFQIPGSRYALEWKRSSEQKVESRYTILDIDSLVETPVSREEFRGALRVIRLKGISRQAGPTLNLLINRVVKELPKDTYLSLRLTDSKVTERFLLLPETASMGRALEVPIIRVSSFSRFLALLPSGTVFSIGTGDHAARSTSLPELPPGFEYTDLAYVDGWLVVSWEEVDFYNVGAAGLMMMPYSP